MKHLDKKYFRYRADIVGRAQAQYPARARILAASEYMRLGFIFAGSLVAGLIWLVLAVTAIARVGAFEWRTLTFAVFALFSFWIMARVFWAMLTGRRQKPTATGS